MSADVDIDLADRSKVLELIQYTAARQEHHGKIRAHNTGVYVTQIPRDPFTNLASIDYEQADRLGYFKIDLLNNSIYTLVKDQEHYDRMLALEPDWSLLWTNQEVSQKVTHVGNYWRLLGEMKPDTVLKMAAFISLIRPGKAHLKNKPWDEVLETVWKINVEEEDGYSFKKSHAISYAMLVKLHLNLIHSLYQCDRATFRSIGAELSKTTHGTVDNS